MYRQIVRETQTTQPNPYGLFEPATTMRWRVEQPASAIIESIILSPVVT
jgi:hypothetical protein